MRVNAHPANPHAMGLNKAVASLGLAVDTEVLAEFSSLFTEAIGFDLQLNVNERGIPQDTFALEVYLADRAMGTIEHDKGCVERVLTRLERLGMADARCRSLYGVELSRQVSLPFSGALAPCAVSVRPFSVKVKIKSGRPLFAKMYLRGDAAFLNV